MDASRRRPVWVLIPAKHLRQIGVLTNPQSSQSHPSKLHNEFPSQNSSNGKVLEDSGKSQRNEKDIDGVGEELATGADEYSSSLVDRSSQAHCEVERKRKQRIAGSIHKLANMLQLKEIDSKKLVKADILKLAVDKIHMLKRSNAELEAKIARNASSGEPAASTRQFLDDKLEGLLLEHLSLKKQLLLSQKASSPETTSSNGCGEEEPRVSEMDVTEQPRLQEQSSVSGSSNDGEGSDLVDRTTQNSERVSECTNFKVSLEGTQDASICASEKEENEKVHEQNEIDFEGSECGMENLGPCSEDGSGDHTRILEGSGKCAVDKDLIIPSSAEQQGDGHKDLMQEEELVKSQDLPASDHDREGVSAEVGHSNEISSTAMLEQLACDGSVAREPASAVVQPPPGVPRTSVQPHSDDTGMLGESPSGTVMFKQPPSGQHLTNPGLLEHHPDSTVSDIDPSRAESSSGVDILKPSTTITRTFPDKPPSPAGLELLLTRDSCLEQTVSVSEGPCEKDAGAKHASSGGACHKDDRGIDLRHQSCDIREGAAGLQLQSTVTSEGLNSNSAMNAVTCTESETPHHSDSAILSSEQTSTISPPSSHQAPLLPTDAVQSSLSLSSSSPGSVPSSTPSHIFSSSNPSAKEPVSLATSSSAHTYFSHTAGVVSQNDQPWPVSSLLSESNIPMSSSSNGQSVTTCSEYSNPSSNMSVRINNLTSILSSDLANSSSGLGCPISYSDSAGLIPSSNSAVSNATSSSSSTCTTTPSDGHHSVACQVGQGMMGNISGNRTRSSREEEVMVNSRLNTDSQPRKRARTGEPPTSLYLGAAVGMGVSRCSVSSDVPLHGYHHVPSQPGPSSNQMTDGQSSLDGNMNQAGDSRHLTFTTNTRAHSSSLPNPQQASHLYSHHSHPSSVIVQPWLDQANGQTVTAPLRQLHRSRTNRSTSNRSTGRDRGLEENGRFGCSYYKPWTDGRQQQQTFSFTSQPVAHPFPHPLQPHPPQHLDQQQPHPHTLFYQPHEYDSWSQYCNKMMQSYHHGSTSALPPPAGSGWRTRFSSTQPYLQRPTMALSDGGGSGERQWDACSHQQQRHSASFMPHDHVMSCEGVWRPYSETSPSSRGFCASDPPAPPSLPSHNLAYMDHATPPSSQHHHSMPMGHISTAHSNCSETNASHPIQMGPPSHPIPLRQTTSHQESHFLQMEPSQPSSHHPNHSNALPNRQHALQMEHTQPTSRTESFFC